MATHARRRSVDLGDVEHAASRRAGAHRRAVDELEFVENRWSALAFQEGGRVGDGAADEVQPEAVPFPGPHLVVVRDPRTQVGLVLHRRLGAALRAVEVHPRFALAWLDVQPHGIILGSVHSPDSWSSDVDSFAAFLGTLSEAVARLAAKAPPSAEVALGGHWNVSADEASLASLFALRGRPRGVAQVTRLVNQKTRYRPFLIIFPKYPVGVPNWLISSFADFPPICCFRVPYVLLCVSPWLG